MALQKIQASQIPENVTRVSVWKREPGLSASRSDVTPSFCQQRDDTASLKVSLSARRSFQLIYGKLIALDRLPEN
jgi:hypothetical protein